MDFHTTGSAIGRERSLVAEELHARIADDRALALDVITILVEDVAASSSTPLRPDPADPDVALERLGVWALRRASSAAVAAASCRLAGDARSVAAAA